MFLRNLGDPHAAVVLEGVHHAAAGDTRRRVRVLDGAAEHLVVVEEPRGHVLHVLRSDEVGAVDVGLATGVTRPTGAYVWQLHAHALFHHNSYNPITSVLVFKIYFTLC